MRKDCLSMFAVAVGGLLLTATGEVSVDGLSQNGGAILLDGGGRHVLTGNNSGSRAYVTVTEDSTVVLSGLTLRNEGVEQPPLRIANRAKVTVLVNGDCYLSAGDRMAGICVEEGAELTIDRDLDCPPEVAVLHVRCGSSGVGIGCRPGKDDTAGNCGNVVINGGTVILDVDGKDGGVGIGCRAGASATSGTVRINGGTVEIGESYATAISAPAGVIIAGGTVKCANGILGSPMTADGERAFPVELPLAEGVREGLVIEGLDGYGCADIRPLSGSQGGESLYLYLPMRARDIRLRGARDSLLYSLRPEADRNGFLVKRVSNAEPTAVFEGRLVVEGQPQLNKDVAATVTIGDASDSVEVRFRTDETGCFAVGLPVSVSAEKFKLVRCKVDGVEAKIDKTTMMPTVPYALVASEVSEVVSDRNLTVADSSLTVTGDMTAVDVKVRDQLSVGGKITADSMFVAADAYDLYNVRLAPGNDGNNRGKVLWIGEERVLLKQKFKQNYYGKTMTFTMPSDGFLLVDLNEPDYGAQTGVMLGLRVDPPGNSEDFVDDDESNDAGPTVFNARRYIRYGGISGCPSHSNFSGIYTVAVRGGDVVKVMITTKGGEAVSGVCLEAKVAFRPIGVGN